MEMVIELPHSQEEARLAGANAEETLNDFEISFFDENVCMRNIYIHKVVLT